VGANKWDLAQSALRPSKLSDSPIFPCIDKSVLFQPQTHCYHLRETLNTIAPSAQIPPFAPTHLCFMNPPHSFMPLSHRPAKAFGVTFGALEIGNLDS
jgi:hypothetical protein